MSGKEKKELATFSAGIVVTVTPESIEVTTNKLSDDPSTDDERTCAVIAGVLIRKAAANIDEGLESLFEGAGQFVEQQRQQETTSAMNEVMGPVMAGKVPAKTAYNYLVNNPKAYPGHVMGSLFQGLRVFEQAEADMASQAWKTRREQIDYNTDRAAFDIISGHPTPSTGEINQMELADRIQEFEAGEANLVKAEAQAQEALDKPAQDAAKLKREQMASLKQRESDAVQRLEYLSQKHPLNIADIDELNQFMTSALGSEAKARVGNLIQIIGSDEKDLEERVSAYKGLQRYWRGEYTSALWDQINLDRERKPYPIERKIFDAIELPKLMGETGTQWNELEKLLIKAKDQSLPHVSEEEWDMLMGFYGMKEKDEIAAKIDPDYKPEHPQYEDKVLRIIQGIITR